MLDQLPGPTLLLQPSVDAKLLSHQPLCSLVLIKREAAARVRVDSCNRKVSSGAACQVLRSGIDALGLDQALAEYFDLLAEEPS